MAVNKTYTRPKSVPTNSTVIAITTQAAEKPNAPEAMKTDTGTTGNLHCLIRADAIESGGGDVQNLFKLETAIAVDAVTGQITLVVTVTPVLGTAGGTDGTPKVMTVEHEQTMSAWQTSAGRPPQP